MIRLQQMMMMDQDFDDDEWNQYHHQSDCTMPHRNLLAVDEEAPKDPMVYRARRSFCFETNEVTPPAQYVQLLLGEEFEENHESHPLFLEMEELVRTGDDYEWKETARWVKFEEDVEKGGNRWSKPHVGTLSLHSLFELRSLLLNNIVMLDMEAKSLDQIADQVLDKMIYTCHLPQASRDKFRQAILRPHRHLHQKKKNNNSLRRGNSRSDKSDKGSSFKRFQKKKKYNSVGNSSPSPPDTPTSPVSPLPPPPSSSDDVNGNISTVQATSENGKGVDHGQLEHGDSFTNKGNTALMRKIPPGAEACNILVGEVDFLEKPLSAFVRLSQAVVQADMTEVPVPTRFVFVLLGPMGGISLYHEIGRAMATLLSDEVFHEVSYKAKNRGHLLAGVDEFLDAVTVLPPAKWDPSIRIEPPAAIPSQDPRKRPPEQPKCEVDEEMDERKLREESGLVRTGKLFGGLINDVKRKRPWYWSDYTDALAIQTIASSIFLYLGCLTPIITFGGLLGKATHQKMAAMESLISGFVCGIGYGLFSGQPLTILGSTGPVLVFEAVVVEFCDAYELDYLEFRVWIGLWMGLILIILVAVDASAVVCYITRFTEENFATLIAVIFIVEAFKNVFEIKTNYPVNPHTDTTAGYSCECTPGNSTNENATWSTVPFDECETPPYNGELIGEGCGYYPDVFLMSMILFLGTFLISVTLKSFRISSFFPTKVRQLVSDFAVIIAIMTMTCIDMLGGVRTPKLEVPETFQPTIPTRGWFVEPFGTNPFWTIFGALLPALLATILIFMDQNITTVIVNRKEHKLKKGCGYHLDLLVLAILIIICSFLGIPWFAAATVRAMNHVDSLKMESECAAPGEKPQFLGVREQRVTQLIIATMIGLSVSITPVLKNIPMPVLYGVFLYMGFTGLKGMQFFDRILIFFMPTKYQPDYGFLRQVPLLRVHLFTMIQIGCLAMLWLIKSFKSTSILFPLMLVVMIIVRKLLDYVFTQRELKCLDDIMPQDNRKPKKKSMKGDPMDSEHKILVVDESGTLQIPLAKPNQLKIPLCSVNITEELNKTGIWKQVNKNLSGSPAQDPIFIPNLDKDKHVVRKRASKKDAISDDERMQLAVMAEEEETETVPSMVMMKVDQSPN